MNGGREYQPTGQPEHVTVHEFPDKELGKAIPYGIYDVSANTGWVTVGATTTPRRSPSRRCAAGGTPSGVPATPAPTGC